MLPNLTLRLASLSPRPHYCKTCWGFLRNNLAPRRQGALNRKVIGYKNWPWFTNGKCLIIDGLFFWVHLDFGYNSGRCVREDGRGIRKGYQAKVVEPTNHKSVLEFVI